LAVAEPVEQIVDVTRSRLRPPYCQLAALLWLVAAGQQRSNTVMDGRQRGTTLQLGLLIRSTDAKIPPWWEPLLS
jgi:hypothetical protein